MNKYFYFLSLNRFLFCLSIAHRLNKDHYRVLLVSAGKYHQQFYRWVYQMSVSVFSQSSPQIVGTLSRFYDFDQILLLTCQFVACNFTQTLFLNYFIGNNWNVGLMLEHEKNVYPKINWFNNAMKLNEKLLFWGIPSHD